MIDFLKNSGFCAGVRNAYETCCALAPKVENGETVYLYGNLANNSHMMESLAAKGFVVIDSLDGAREGNTVVIRSHGVPEAVYAFLAEKNVGIVDCTCQVVKNIQRVVKEKTESGDTVIIIGKKGHPEVVGIHGWCKEGHAYVAESLSDLEADFSGKSLSVVGQTTCDKNFWDEAVSYLSKNFPAVKIHDTLCNVVAERVVRASEIAKNSDVMFIVGDVDSANSMKLLQSCRSVCKDVRFVSCIHDLTDAEDAFARSNPAEICSSSRLAGFTPKRIGLAGSASTPDDLLETVYSHLLFLEFLSETKHDVAKAGGEFFMEKISDASEMPFVEDALKDLYFQHKNGKAIRAAMIKLGELTASGKNIQFLPIALAYELFQTSILIHDDIIDKSPLRRGKNTIHAKPGDSHLSLSRAICIGDLGLFLSNKIMAEAEILPDVLVKLYRLFSRIQLTTLHGEIMDVCLPYEPIDIRTENEKFTSIVGSIYEMKTAWYTLAGPAMLGAICGGAGDETLELLKNITLPLGVAFQIKDDILGIYASTETLGKSNLSDMREKKQTLLFGFAAKNARPEELDFLNRTYGNPDSDETDLKTVREIFTRTGALKYAEDEIFRLSKISTELICSLEEGQRPVFRGLVSYLVNRRY